MVSSVSYEEHTLEEEGRAPVPNQMIITNQDGTQTGVWVTITVHDDGPGFPEEKGTTLDFKDTTLIRHRPYIPAQNKSTHEGQGIFLDTLQKNVSKAGGICKIYTDLDNGGAVISISFPLLRKVA